MYQALETLMIEDDIRMEHRVMLSATTINGATGERSTTFHALNEVVVVKKSTEAMIRLVVGPTRSTSPPIEPMA